MVASKPGGAEKYAATRESRQTCREARGGGRRTRAGRERGEPGKSSEGKEGRNRSVYHLLVGERAVGRSRGGGVHCIQLGHSAALPMQGE